MSGIKGKDTSPEIFLRRSLHALGFRYRLGGGGLPGRPDLVLPKWKAVIFVHGCFWHMHDCSYFKWPKSNPEFWRNKIRSNAARDRRVLRELEALGWRVFTIWECELRATRYTLPNPAIDQLRKAVMKASSTSLGRSRPSAAYRSGRSLGRS